MLESAIIDLQAKYEANDTRPYLLSHLVSNFWIYSRYHRHVCLQPVQPDLDHRCTGGVRRRPSIGKQVPQIDT
jgi:hypothetical protein